MTKSSAEFYQRDRSWHPPAYTHDNKTSVTRSPHYPLISLEQSTGEITGPVFGHNDIDPLDHDLLKNYANEGEPIGERIIVHGPNAKGERIRVDGLVIDGTGSPIKDVLLEIWQANSEGVYAHTESNGEVEDGLCGWGRVSTDFSTGEWAFDTVKPGATMGRNGGHQAPYINLWIVARGINVGLNTRIYFEDEDNSMDQVLGGIEWESRRATLIAKKVKDGLYRFDVKIRGEDETVFFDI